MSRETDVEVLMHYIGMIIGVGLRQFEQGQGLRCGFM